jgi:hypothetical protein
LRTAPVEPYASLGALLSIGLLALTVASAVALVTRQRAISSRRARDATLLSRLRACVRAGRFHEAREVAAADDGPLAACLRELLRFPHGSHREAIELSVEQTMASRGAAVARSSVFLGVAASASAFAAIVLALAWPAGIESRGVLAAESLLSSALFVAAAQRVRAWDRAESSRIAQSVALFGDTLAIHAESPAIFAALRSERGGDEWDEAIRFVAAATRASGGTFGR